MGLLLLGEGSSPDRALIRNVDSYVYLPTFRNVRTDRGRSPSIGACIRATSGPPIPAPSPLFYRPARGRFAWGDPVIPVTRKSIAAAAEKQAMAGLASALRLDSVPSSIQSRVIKYATTLGVVVARSESPLAWYTREGLRLLARAAEVVADHLVRERNAKDRDASALRYCAFVWRRWCDD